jgi:hypothetical protein
MDLLSLWCRTPHSKFVVNEVGVNNQRTAPPNRGVHVSLLTLTSFAASKARGVLLPRLP